MVHGGNGWPGSVARPPTDDKAELGRGDTAESHRRQVTSSVAWEVDLSDDAARCWRWGRLGGSARTERHLRRRWGRRPQARRLAPVPVSGRCTGRGQVLWVGRGAGG